MKVAMRQVVFGRAGRAMRRRPKPTAAAAVALSR
jgi:hypothetical protein